MNERHKKQMESSLKILIPLGVVYAISLLGFPKGLKEQAIQERGARCEKCGYGSDFLYPHHDLPEQMGGSNSIWNLFLACFKCHPKLDRAVIYYGRLADGTPIREVETEYPEKIGDWNKYKKAVRRFQKKFRNN